MEEPRPALEVVTEGFQAFTVGGPEAAAARAHPEIEVFVPDSLPNHGSFRGRDAYIGWILAWLEAWDEFEIEILEHEPLGEAHVVTRTFQRGTGRGSGAEVEMESFWMTEVRDDQFAVVHLYPTIEEARAAARERESRRSE
jgi:ketosteroid isomerase-like protein